MNKPVSYIAKGIVPILLSKINMDIMHKQSPAK